MIFYAKKVKANSVKATADADKRDPYSRGGRKAENQDTNESEVQLTHRFYPRC